MLKNNRIESFWYTEINMWARQKQFGSTIVELLIVIGILAAITVVAYSGIQKKAQQTSLLNETYSIVNKLDLYKVDNAMYPTSIIDCPSPAAANICLTPVSGESYTYASNLVGGPSWTIDVKQSYELIVMGSSQVLYTSSAEKTGGNEFMQYMDLAPIIDRYGLGKYQLSFDIKSANTANRSVAHVYFQNGSGARYGGLETDVNVTTSYVHQTVTFTPSMSNSTIAASTLAFYRTYGTGNILTVKNLQIQRAP